MTQDVAVLAEAARVLPALHADAGLVMGNVQRDIVGGDQREEIDHQR